ncbi:MAG TPA: tRNA methyl transferase PRC-barrel domain-containing protein, partial [Spirochaetia bacterium]|nr:tRNA methyl transferase PRC-barrel domain-containing protein [Spirochaetia bacterium]
MSGGVDSSVAACLLEVEHRSSIGRPVVGVSQLIWAKESQFPAALDLARDVCLRLGIPYFRVDLNREFERLIVRNFIDTYLEGQTPNPCVLCNQMIKFDILYRKVESELRTRGNLGEQDTLYFATGHYARVEAEEGGYALKKGRDASKDQSYMLYRLPRSLLSRIVFPLGGLEKKEVIRMASRLDLPHREIRESQDACFLEGSYGDYLVKKTGRVDLRHPGDIVDAGGRVLGRHRGFIRYTVGQRRGLGLGSGPWYVSRVDPIKNRVVV